jgi:hypothetical protein
MIIFDLCCEGGHRFEGWFRDAAEFVRQKDENFLSCPVCESVEIRRVPSAVAIGHGARDSNPNDGTRSAGEGSATFAVPAAATEVLAAYRQFVATLQAASEDVGGRFADEARKIHAGETHERAIRGQASREEFDALTDEGIAVIRLPIIGDMDLN